MNNTGNGESALLGIIGLLVVAGTVVISAYQSNEAKLENPDNTTEIVEEVNNNPNPSKFCTDLVKASKTIDSNTQNTEDNIQIDEEKCNKMLKSGQLKR